MVVDQDAGVSGDAVKVSLDFFRKSVRRNIQTQKIIYGQVLVTTDCTLNSMAPNPRLFIFLILVIFSTSTL